MSDDKIAALHEAARLQVTDVLTYTALEVKAQDEMNARDFAAWKAQVRRLAKEIKGQEDTRTRQEARTRRASSTQTLVESTGVRIDRQDNASIARALVTSYIGDAEGEGLAYEYGKAWRWDKIQWQEIHDAAISARLQSWSGLLVPVDGDTRDEEIKIAPLKINATKPIRDMMLDRIADPVNPRAEGWLASGQEGLAFKDAVILQDEAGNTRVVPHNANLRTQHVYPYTTQQVITGDCPKWLAMLTDGFAPLGEALAADSIRCLQEFCGAAVMGLATRYHRALVLQGEPGSGKSEIIRVIKALVTGHNPHPTRDRQTGPWSRYLSSVDLSQWHDPNFVAPFTTARLNASSDISRDALREPGRLLTIINGEELTVRPVYERAYKFAPRTAHIFATNDLPQVLAGEEFWDRFLLLRMMRRMRESATQVEFYGWVVANEELPGIIAWALEGAARLRERGRYELGTLRQDIRERWRDESNPVAEWATSNIVVDDGGWEATADLRGRFLIFAKDRGYAENMSERVFVQRLQQLGFTRHLQVGTRRSGFKVRWQ